MRPDREDIYSQLPTLGRAAIGFGECRRSKCRIQMVAERAFLDIAVLRARHALSPAARMFSAVVVEDRAGLLRRLHSRK
jgi:hypothetical protein